MKNSAVNDGNLDYAHPSNFTPEILEALGLPTDLPVKSMTIQIASDDFVEVSLCTYVSDKELNGIAQVTKEYVLARKTEMVSQQIQDLDALKQLVLDSQISDALHKELLGLILRDLEEDAKNFIASRFVQFERFTNPITQKKIQILATLGLDVSLLGSL